MVDAKGQLRIGPPEDMAASEAVDIPGEAINAGVPEWEAEQ
jgi:hypothetical protein